LHRRTGGPQSQSGRCEDEKNFTPAGENEREKENINMQGGITQAAFELIRLTRIRNEKEKRIEIRESVVDEIRTQMLSLVATQRTKNKLM
jgi:hypothetical protein